MNPPAAATRRRFLRGGSVIGTTLLGGCGRFDSGSGRDSVRTPTADSDAGDPTDGPTDDAGGGRVFVPEHFHETAGVADASSGGLSVALRYSEPDFYWRVRSDGSTELVEPSSDASMQLLAWVWDRETGVLLEDAAVTAEISKDGDPVVEGPLVALLKQRTGLHWARNLGLSRYGEYDVTLRVETGECRYGGELAGRLPESSALDLELAYERGDMDEVGTVYLDQAGERGAVRPMSTDAVPLNGRPDPVDRPGEVLGGATSDAAEVRAVRLSPDESPLGASDPYLAVILRTPFNEYSLPRAELAGTLSRDGETVFEGRLVPTIDGSQGYHYGASVPSIERGDELTVAVDAPPAVARFDGYERAFLRTSERTMQLE